MGTFPVVIRRLAYTRSSGRLGEEKRYAPAAPHESIDQLDKKKRVRRDAFLFP